MFRQTRAQAPEAADCGDKGDAICTETGTCQRFLPLFRRNCSSEFDYIQYLTLR